jgi:hypothetical protein
MRSWPVSLLLALAALSAALVAGCGSARSEDQGASGSLIDLKNLPAGAALKEEVPEPCGPLPILEGKKAQVAHSKSLGFGSVLVKEAIGIFLDTENAVSAYEGLTSLERDECIFGALESFGPPGRIEPDRGVPLDIASEDLVTRYLVVGGRSRPRGSIDVVALRSGACVIALLFCRKAKLPIRETYGR